MPFSSDYADAYDSLYHDKDYAKECDYLEALFNRHRCRPRTILDVGCGTGSHALILAGRGYGVTGLDRSSAMLEIARKKAADAGLGIRLREGDITNISLHETYDAVIALFAVMGLQTSGDALASALQTIKAALACGGIFLFDCWNGYAVEHDRLATRHKEVDAGDGVKIARLSLAEIEATEQIVHVGMKLRHTRGNEITETAESQSVKYFYPEQIRHILTVAGFQDIDIHPFLSPDAVLTAKDWSMMVAAR